MTTDTHPYIKGVTNDSPINMGECIRAVLTPSNFVSVTAVNPMIDSATVYLTPDGARALIAQLNACLSLIENEV